MSLQFRTAVVPVLLINRSGIPAIQLRIACHATPRLGEAAVVILVYMEGMGRIVHLPVILHVYFAGKVYPIIASAVRHLNSRIRQINALLATLVAKLARPLPQTVVHPVQLIIDSA